MPRFCLIFFLMLALMATGAWTQEPATLRVGEFVQRLSLRSPDRLPASLAPRGKKKIQLAIVIDATTTMEKEIRSLEARLHDVARLFGGEESDKGEAIEWSIVLYGDSEDSAKADETVILLEPGNSNIERVIGKLSTVKVLSPEPYAQNLVDRGIHKALTEVGWKSDDQAVKHLVIVGDSPAYGANSKARKHQTDDLIQLAKQKGVQIHAIHPATTALDPESSGEVRRLTNQFYRAITAASRGLHIDLADTKQVEASLGRTVQIEGIDPALLHAPSAPPSFTDADPQQEDWLRLIKDYEGDPHKQRSLVKLLRELASPGLAVEDASSATKKLAALTSDLESRIRNVPKSASLHMHLVAAYDRLAGFGAYNEAAQQRSLHAWLATQHAAALTDLLESIKTENKANKALFIDNEAPEALSQFQRLVELKDETGNPGSTTRGRVACIRLLFAEISRNQNSDQTRPQAEQLRAHLESMLKETPYSPFAIVMRNHLKLNTDKKLWLHEDYVYAPY